MKNSIKTLLAFGLVTALGTGGTALVANARGNTPTAVRDARIAQTVNNGNQQSPDNEATEAPGSEVNEGPENGTENEANDVNDAQEMAQYQSLAKITQQQAQQAAEKAQGATATKVELGSEDGNLVYEVDFANAEVLVDAGNGQILKTEAAGQEQNDATEAPISSSIQVPDNDGGDQGQTQQ